MLKNSDMCDKPAHWLDSWSCSSSVNSEPSDTARQTFCSRASTPTPARVSFDAFHAFHAFDAFDAFDACLHV